MNQRLATTQDLLNSASKCDATAVEELVVRYLPELRAFLRLRIGARLGQRETPTDLAQSVCREVLQDVSAFRYQGDSSFKRWLFLHAQRKVASKGRFHGQERRSLDREESMSTEAFASAAADLLTPSRDAMAKDELQVFAEVLESLPADQRDAIVLCRGLEMTSTEAAQELGKTANAVRICLHRGLARLGTLQQRILDERR